MMYHSTPRTTTGVSPTEMLFGRCIRTKLPQLQEFSDEDEVRDSESERKEKRKVCANCKRKVHESKIQKGDKVLLKQEKENKLSTPYSLPLQLFRRMAIVFLSRQMAYNTHVKKYLEQHNAPQATNRLQIPQRLKE